MIHSVKDFLDKKMNNKLICFNWKVVYLRYLI